MPHIDAFKQSKYLTKEDAGNGKTVTIKHMAMTNLAKESAPPDLKPVLFFHEFEKGMVLNQTNLQLAAQALQQPNTDFWVGGRIVIYNDPSVQYAGKMMGGLRIRAASMEQPPAQQPQQGVYQQNQQPPPSAPSMDEDEDDLPF